MLTHCRCAQPPVCVGTHMNDHVYTHVKDPVVHIEFGGLRQHEKTQHALVGLGSTAFAAAVA